MKLLSFLDVRTKTQPTGVRNWRNCDTQEGLYWRILRQRRRWSRRDGRYQRQWRTLGCARFQWLMPVVICAWSYSTCVTRIAALETSKRVERIQSPEATPWLSRPHRGGGPPAVARGGVQRLA